jgi:cytochrome P450
MLSKFMSARGPDATPMAFDNLVNEAIVIVVAGADTTSIGINATLRYVYSNPQCLVRLREEIDDALNSGGMDLPPNYDQTAKLPYLQAVIKEAMRMHPAVGMPLQRVVPVGGRLIGGTFYPAGVCVGMAGPLIHQHQDAYGSDAAIFRPERWLDGETDRPELEKYNLTFGQGSRVCLGKNISLMVSRAFQAITHIGRLAVADQQCECCRKCPN